MKNSASGTGSNTAETSSVKSLSRRGFLDYLLGTTVFATLGAILYPIFRFMSPPQIIEATQNSVEVGKVSEMAVNTGKIFKFGNKPGIIVRTQSGEFKAFSAECTHLQCIVQYKPESKQIWCACHNGQYNLNGKNVGGPPPRPLEEYARERVSGFGQRCPSRTRLTASGR